jgi:5-methylcytosine-specific restriction protein A
MSTELHLVETPHQVLEALQRFNRDAAAHADRARSILRGTQYWVLNADSGEFGPGKFVGFAGMDYGSYEDGNQGRTTGVKFDGHFTKNAIEAALEDAFAPNEELHPILRFWGTRLLGEDAFGGANADKWKFHVYSGDPETADASAGDSSQQADSAPPSVRNPPWQRDELIRALDVYVRHSGNPPSHSHPDIVDLSRLLNALPIHSRRTATFRNENGVYLKLMNFRRFDPTKPGVSMTRGNKLEEEVWKEFEDQPLLLKKVAEQIRSAYVLPGVEEGLDEDEAAFPEGKILYRLHRLRERNKALIAKAKTKAKATASGLRCSVCDFDFQATYGELGEGFIEAHHTKPVSELSANATTKIEDIALLCSNCHRMVHRRRPWLSIDKLQAILETSVKTSSE